MIAERTQWTAKRLDNGELVKGYYVCVIGEIHVIFTGKIDITTIKTGGEITKENYEIDPSTLEPVAVAPIFDGKLYACPNCRMIELHNSRNKYCPECGLRLDWNANAADVERGEKERAMN